MPSRPRNTSHAGRGPSRLARERELAAQARTVQVPSQVDVAVVGGGASGLAAAITAAEAGARVVVVERALECGRSILATGGGRCNLANADLSAERYRHPGFVSAVCGERFLADVQGFFSACGLAVAEEEGGRLYPVTREASSVREVLVERARRAHVTLACGREVAGVSRGTDGLRLRLAPTFDGGNQEVLCARAVVIATGGKEDSLARSLGLPVVDARPVLCPLACEGLDFPKLDGRRARVAATLVRDGVTIAREAGELLFRSYGISGIVSFDLSRNAQPGDRLVLDLLPEVSARTACELAVHGGTAGLLDNEVAAQLGKLNGTAEDVVAHAKAVELLVTGIADEKRAQVTAGGIDVEALDASTLSSPGAPDVFTCGEAVDVDGACGGFNLAWAWKSGMVAGASAARLAGRR